MGHFETGLIEVALPAIEVPSCDAVSEGRKRIRIVWITLKRLPKEIFSAPVALVGSHVRVGESLKIEIISAEAFGRL